MKILLTLDYELFLGAKAGTVGNCLVQPLDLYLQSLQGLDVPFTIFVDAAYLYALSKWSTQHSQLATDLDLVSNHLRALRNQGHDIQLHIHPQWYYSTFNGTEWQLDTRHYKLSDVPEDEMRRLFAASKTLLDNIVGIQTTVFRAGGFTAQPTSLLTTLLADNGLVADSSVCPGAYYDSPYQQYDYRQVADACAYPFEADICQRQAGGRYTEVPISMYSVSPLFHWRLLVNRVLTKLVKSRRHHLYSDGQSVRSSQSSIMHRLLHTTSTMATIDGYKISFLRDAIDAHAAQGDATMCVLGHPKLATPYSVRMLREVCLYALHQGHTFHTLHGQIIQ